MGCPWTGELVALQEHLERIDGPGCKYAVVMCPNRCASGCAMVRRIDLKIHLETECPLRPYECEQCRYKSTYEEIAFVHYCLCPEFPLHCPNGCGMIKIKRRYIDDHRKICPLEEIECPFAEVGCYEKIARYQFGEHLSFNSEHHLLLVLSAYKEMKQSCEELRRRVDYLEGQPKLAKRARRC